MAELKIDGRMKVETLKNNFKEVFGGTLRVYKDNKNHLADDSQLLCDLRTDDAPATGEFLCRSSITVAGFRKRMQKTFGITVKVATIDDWVLVLDDITLANVGKIPKQATIEIMQQFRSNYGKKAEGKEKKGDYIHASGIFNEFRSMTVAIESKNPEVMDEFGSPVEFGDWFENFCDDAEVSTDLEFRDISEAILEKGDVEDEKQLAFLVFFNEIICYYECDFADEDEITFKYKSEILFSDTLKTLMEKYAKYYVM